MVYPTLNGEPDRSFELDGNVNYLAAHTYHFSFTDPAVRSVLFINPFHDDTWPTAHVNAIYRLADGSWKVEDWTKKYTKGFCRDLQAERIEDLTIIISNHEWKDRQHELKPSYPPRLNVTNVACRGWKFEGVATATGKSQDGSMFEKTTVSATFVPDTSRDSNSAYPFAIYHVSEGSGAWTHQGSDFACSANESGTFELTGGFQTIVFVHTNATDSETSTRYVPGDRRYSGFGTEGFPVLDSLWVTYHCKDGSTTKVAVFTSARWFETETVATQQVDESGTIINGSYTIEQETVAGTYTRKYEWTMTALPPE